MRDRVTSGVAAGNELRESLGFDFKIGQLATGVRILCREEIIKNVSAGFI